MGVGGGRCVGRENLSQSNRCVTGVRLRIYALATLLLTASGAVLAQSQPPAAPTSQTSADAGQADTGGALQEIVVTVNKRRENMQDVPIAISAISQSDLAAHGIENTLDVAAAVPAGFA